MKKLFLSTFGCKINQYESQVLRQLWRDKGYDVTENIEDADEAIINTCTVTNEADKQCRYLIRQILRKKTDIKIIVTGCYAEIAEKEIKEISNKIEIIRKDEIIDKDSSYNNITDFEGHSRAFVKIQDGCNAFCSYCIIPYTRSNMWSRPKQKIIEEIKNLVDNGYPEIVLSGVNLGRYKYGLTDLVKDIIEIDGNFRIRLSSLEPNDIQDGLVEMIAFSSKICKHLHLPLQSGSNKILKLMNRPYVIEKYRHIVEKLYNAIPDIAITTDIITGFPGETEEDFLETCNFIKICNFSKLHVFRYSPRKGTAAASFGGQVSHSTVMRRAKSIRELGEKLQNNFICKFINTVRPAVIEANKSAVITDNYIRLPLKNAMKLQSYNSIVNIKIQEFVKSKCEAVIA